MTTEELMQIALDLVGFRQIPADSAIHVRGTGIRKVFFAVDVSSAEILVASKIGCDCVLGHHPRGKAASTYHAIIDRQTELLQELGVPSEQALKATKRQREVFFYSSHRANWEEVVLTAETLAMPFLNVHNPLDELGRRLIQAKLAERETAGWKLGDALQALLEFPEIARAPLEPVLAMGIPDAPAGRIAVFHGVGTNGWFGAADALFRHGYDTVLYIHIDAGELEKLRQAHPTKNLIISGHIGSDMVGINPYLTKLEQRGVQVQRLSDFLPS